MIKRFTVVSCKGMEPADLNHIVMICETAAFVGRKVCTLSVCSGFQGGQ